MFEIVQMSAEILGVAGQETKKVIEFSCKNGNLIGFSECMDRLRKELVVEGN